jgi:hypothetical protein
MRQCIWVFLLFLGVESTAQDFPPGWIVPLELGQGFVKSSSTPELYLLSLQVVPQITLKEGLLRAGLVAGGLYNNSQLNAWAGPRVAVKLFSGGKILTAGSFHVQLLGEYLLSTASNRLLGGAIALESSNLVAFSLRYHYDTQGKSSWFQTGISFNLSSKRNPEL